jgi:phytoene dehydrogenase-like protein
MPDYDVVIIGGGPNGETVGSYLAKAGAKCLIIERRDEMGGGLITEDNGGFRFNYHATYGLLGELAPPFNDLFLPQYGASFIRPDIQLHINSSEGKSLTVYRNRKRTAKAIGKISAKDAVAFTKLYDVIVELNEKIIIPWHFTPPLPPDVYAQMLSKSEIWKKFLRIQELSPVEILDEYGVEDDVVRGALLYPGCVWGPDPKTRGVGQYFAFFLYRMTNAGLVAGGSHRLSSSLLRSYYENEGEVLEDTVATKVVVKDGEAKGVLIETGREISAKAVVSTLNPKQTFLELVGEEHLGSDLAKKVRNWKWDEWSMFMVHLGLKKAPVYQSHDGEGRRRALLQLIGYDGEDDMLEHWKDCRKDRLPSAAGGWTCTSEIDATQAPEGLHVGRMETQVPYKIGSDDWNDLKEDYASNCIDNWLNALENKSEMKILMRFYYPPNYIENKLPEMAEGSIRHGAYIPEQVGYYRPHESCSGSRTPIKNLYVAGASTHPGGMVTLGPGYIAANIIAKDLGVKPWWKPPEFLTRARRDRLVP